MFFFPTSFAGSFSLHLIKETKSNTSLARGRSTLSFGEAVHDRIYTKHIRLAKGS